MTYSPTALSAATRLRTAAETRIPCQPVRDLIGTEDILLAYTVQSVNTDLRLRAGEKLVGRKIGLTSKAVQRQLGVDQPDFGMLFDTMQLEDGAEVLWNNLMQPKVEAEVAFVTGKDLKGKDIQKNDLIEAIAYAVASLEIVGSRIENWDIRITDTVADNASASHFVLGPQPRALSEIDLVSCSMHLTKNGQQASSGTGQACLGSPLNAALWLARTMAKMGNPLRKNDIILSGALGPMVAVNPGDKISAEISGLGKVGVHFVQS